MASMSDDLSANDPTRWKVSANDLELELVSNPVHGCLATVPREEEGGEERKEQGCGSGTKGQPFVHVRIAGTIRHCIGWQLPQFMFCSIKH